MVSPAVNRPVNGVPVCSTLSHTSRHTYLSDALRIRPPGSTIASTSGTAASACQTRLTSASMTRSIATLTSRSQLEPGKTMTAAFMAGVSRIASRSLPGDGRARCGEGAEAGEEGIDGGALFLEVLRRRPRHQAVAHVGRHHVAHRGAPLADLEELDGGADDVGGVDEV